MAMLSGSSGYGIGAGARRPQPMSEINVTPFVDVMLVLLVIFMITAPLIATGVDVDLPQAKAKQLASDRKPIQISVDSAGHIFVDDAPIARDQFGLTLANLALAAGDPESERVFVRADRVLAYGDVMGLVAEVGAAGFTRVAFVSEPGLAGGEKRLP
jgi:biopolymer transport protein TolR